MLEAMAGCLEGTPDAEIVGVALSTQRESVVGWRAGTGEPLGPVIGWQDRRTAAWCSQALSEQDGQLVTRANRSAGRPDVLRTQDAMAA